MNSMHIMIASMSAAGEITETTKKAAALAKRIVLQTQLSKEHVPLELPYETLDDLYGEASDFEDLTEGACKRLLFDETLFIALGNIFLNELAVRLSQHVIHSGGRVTLLDAADPALAAAFENGLIDHAAGLSVHTASSLSTVQDTDAVLVVHEIDTQIKASELKLRLQRSYGDEHRVLCVDTHKNEGSMMMLCELDQREDYGYYVSAVIPPLPLKKKLRYTFADLVAVMDRLRSQNGCPWDREQTHQSLKRYLIEESYEVLEAVDDNDMDALYDELGDVMLQVVFHAKIAQQSSEFDISDVITAICSKMISRHTHIFGSDVAATPDAVVQNWEQIKRQEKGQQSQTEVLKSVPKSMPALMRSEKVQHKAAHIGFDFRHISEAFDKLYEEIDEVKTDMKNGSDMGEECGDLLFAAVNVVRLLGIEPEVALQKATDKFIARFEQVERISMEKKVDMHACSIEKLDEIWFEAKKIKK